MDTPERSQIAGTPLSKFEDSPLFNFINNLSPIQPVKSAHSVQAYTSPGFTSISSVFSSPHVNLQKESRFSLRQTYSESSKQENSSDSGNESTRISNAVKLSGCIVVAGENCNIKCSFNEATVEPPDDCSTVPSSLPQSMQYDCGSPNHNITPCYGSKLDLKQDVGCKQVELVQFSEDGLDGTKSLFAVERVRGKHLAEQAKEEVPGCDWESLISNDADDLLIFEESTGLETCEGQDTILGNKNANFCTSFSAKLTEDVVDDSQKTQPDASFAPCLEKTMQDRHVICNLEVGEQDETDQAPQMFADVCQNQIVLSTQRQKTGNGTSDSVPFDSKVDSPQQRGMRRRCLFFEASGVSKKNLQNATDLHNSNPLPSKNKFSYDSGLASFKPGASPSPFLLPGIGLHLNTLAKTSKDKMVMQETQASGRQVISMPCSIGPFPPTTSSQKSLDKSLSVEKDVGTTGSEVQELQIMQDDAGRALELGSAEELSQSSPKKKRRKSETGGESEACKRCNCKKSKCLKLYCECFAAGVFCSEPCSCQGCYNKPIHEETVLVTRKQIESRNPLAFAPKVIRTSETFQDMGEEANKTPASARHKRGCNCKKSSCLKKYCECYQSGVGCSINCRCEGCKNAFGRKDDVVPPGVEEPEPGEEEMNACETEDMLDARQENAVVKKDEHHFSESILLATPLQICSTSIKLPFFSIGKPPRSSTPPIGCTPLLNTCRMLKKSEIPLPRHKFGKHISTVPEDDAPEFLSGNGSPDNCVKTSSPNGKRVSPPHSGTGPSQSCKGGRKLILKSIPSFPSLNIDVADESQANHHNSQFSSTALN